MPDGELKTGKRTDGKELKPGTAVFCYNETKKNRSHVGLYIGNGDWSLEAAFLFSDEAAAAAGTTPANIVNMTIKN